MEIYSNIPYALAFILQLIPLVYPLSLLIAHNADMFSQLDQFRGGAIRETIGGFPRTRYAINKCRGEARTKGTICLYMNAGGTLTGSLWHAVYGWEITAHFMKMLQPDVMALGVHDFDISVTNLSAYIRAVGVPVVCANADFSLEPQLAKLVKPYHIFKIDGLKVGVVGYLTPDVVDFGMTGNIKFTSEREALKRTSKEMKEKGIRLIIALGYSGFSQDVNLAKTLQDIAVFVGGMSNTLLWTGPKPGPDIPLDNYPKIVKRPDKSRALVLHAGGFTKYLGTIDIRYSRKGKIMKHYPEAIYLHNSFPQDKMVLDMLRAYRKGVEDYKQLVIGRSKVLLFGMCTTTECNFGNMITDSFVDYVAGHNYTTDAGAWSQSAIALFNGGDIQSNIYPGEITWGGIQTALPYDYYLTIYTVKGSDLLDYLEQAIRAEFLTEIGSFPQVSGLHIEINKRIKVGARISGVRVRCVRCDYPTFVDMARKKWYTVIATNNLLGNNSNPLIPVKEQHRLAVSVWMALAEYIRRKRIIRPEHQERFRYRTK